MHNKKPQYAEKINPYIQTHVLLEEYIGNVKDYCVSCIDPIEYDVECYALRGNYCKRCESQANITSEDKMLTEDEMNALFRNKYPKIH